VSFSFAIVAPFFVAISNSQFLTVGGDDFLERFAMLQLRMRQVRELVRQVRHDVTTIPVCFAPIKCNLPCIVIDQRDRAWA